MDSPDQPGTSFLDDDIDLDFFDVDEPAPRRAERRSERAPAEPAPVPRPSGILRSGRRINYSRLAVVASIVAVVGAVLLMVASTWLGHRQHVAFETYFGDVTILAQESAAQGAELKDVLQQQGVERAQIIERLDDLVAGSNRLVSRAEALDPPRQLRETHAWLVTTLQYRANGFEQLRTVFLPALDNANVQRGAQMVAEANWRLLASDVVYVDSYQSNARRVMKREGVRGVAVPDSLFVAEDAEFASAERARLMLDRFRTAGAGRQRPNRGRPAPGLHGTNLQGVTLQPSGIELQSGVTAEVEGSTELAFEVAIRNGGDHQEVQIPVTIDIRGANSEPLQLRGMLEVIDPEEVVAVRIPMEDIPPFGETLDVRVKVAGVPGEENLDNNVATYQVLFSL